MKLRTDGNMLKQPDSADVAYLLLIFIIIMSLIGTDNISGIKLPKSASKDKPERIAVRLTVTESSFVIGDTECRTLSELQSAIPKNMKECGCIIIADRKCRAKRIKSALRVLEQSGINKVAFMTE